MIRRNKVRDYKIEKKFKWDICGSILTITVSRNGLFYHPPENGIEKARRNSEKIRELQLVNCPHIFYKEDVDWLVQELEDFSGIVSLSFNESIRAEYLLIFLSNFTRTKKDLSKISLKELNIARYLKSELNPVFTLLEGHFFPENISVEEIIVNEYTFETLPIRDLELWTRPYSYKTNARVPLCLFPLEKLNMISLINLSSLNIEDLDSDCVSTYLSLKELDCLRKLENLRVSWEKISPRITQGANYAISRLISCTSGLKEIVLSIIKPSNIWNERNSLLLHSLYAHSNAEVSLVTDSFRYIFMIMGAHQKYNKTMERIDYLVELFSTKERIEDIHMR
eukprot:snap_masked-scaffold_6-processed-gene-8.19-mRNA-1 protein AED:1.00 eAED:1.00 QI:0/0/0/0/1/1/2/0/337